MAVDANSLTYADFALMSNDPLVREIHMAMIDAGAVFQDVPIVDDNSLKHTGARILQTPQINWSPLNGEPVVVKTVPKHYEEQFYFWRNTFEFDHYLQRDKNSITNIVDVESKGLINSSTYELNDALINNTHRALPNRQRTRNLNCFVGIRERLDNSDYGLVTSDLKLQSSVDISGANLTGANVNNLLREIQGRLDAMGAPGGDGVSIYMNDDLIGRIEAGIRLMGSGAGWKITEDAFGRELTMYRRAKVRRVGRLSQTVTGSTISQNYIITSTESQNGMADTGSTYTSIYFAKWGRSSAFAWQFDPPKLYPTFQKDNQVIKSVLFEGGYGIEVPDIRAFARLHGIKVA